MVYVTHLSFSMMHNTASPGSVSSVNFLNILNSLFIFSISSGTNNARLAAMLRQLAQYHAKDPNNLFMVRLAQVGGNTKGALYQTQVDFRESMCMSYCWLSAVCCLHRVWLTWAKAHWHSVPTIATGSWWVRSPWPDCSPCSFPSSMSRTVSSFSSCCFYLSCLLPHALNIVHFCFVILRLYSISGFPVFIFSLMFTVCITVILGKSHYILYGLVAAMQPRMLVTFDEELRPLPVSVRVGQVKSIVVYCNVFLFMENNEYHKRNCSTRPRKVKGMLKAFFTNQLQSVTLKTKTLDI